MPRKSELLYLRDQSVCLRYRTIRKRNPHWKIDYIITLVAKDFFLSEVMIVKILRRTDVKDRVPAPATMSKIVKERAAA